MKFWSISAVVGCLLGDLFVGHHLYAKHHEGYTVQRHDTQLVISWQGQPIVHGTASNLTVAISPDRQSVAWMFQRLYLHPGFTNEADEEQTAYGVLFTAHAGQPAVQAIPPSRSRGVDFQWIYTSPFLTWHPADLRWDSTSQYLYFGTPLAVTCGAVWQLSAGSSSPRFVDSGGDWWLVKEPQGFDQVVIQGLRYDCVDPASGLTVRDYENCYSYTTADIAADRHVQSKKRVRPPGK